MGNRFATLHSTFSIHGEVTGEDTRFLPIVIDLMHTKKNLNGSYFDKETVNACIESIYNTPVLGFIKSDKFTGENDFNGHEYIITRTANGVEESYIGKAFGVIPQTCNPRWVLKVCDDGIEREFLRVDALLWEKFSDATTIIKRDLEKPQSMELEFSSVDGYEDEDGVFHFTQFRFDGACILGDQVEPAMIGANVRINDGFNFSMNDISDAVRRELNDKMEKFNVAFANFTNGEVCSDQGGAKDMLNKEMNQIEEKIEDAVETEAVETETEFEADVETEVVEDVEIKANDEIESGVEAIVDNAEAEFEATEIETETDVESEDEIKVEEETCAEETVVVEEADEVKEETFEHESDEQESADAEECNFSDMQAEIDGLKADLEAVKSDYEEMLASFKEVKAEYDSIKSEYDEIKPKYDEYVQAEAQRVAEELSAQKDAAFAEYESDLAENAEFSALKEKKDEMSLEDIEKECAFLYVKVNRSKNKFSAIESQSAVVGVIGDADESEDSGLVLTKYGYISVSR